MTPVGDPGARKRELLEREDAAWADLHALLDRLTPEQVARIGYYEDWSAKDMVAHMACWMAEAARQLERLRLDTYEPWDEAQTERCNREWHETWRDQPLDVVLAELHSARSRMLEEWDRLPGEKVTSLSTEWFEESSAGHGEEHLPRLREWVEELASSSSS